MKDYALNRSIADIRAIKMTSGERRTVLESILRAPQPIESPWRAGLPSFAIALAIALVLISGGIMKTTDATAPRDAAVGAVGEKQRILQEGKLDAAKVDAVDSIGDASIMGVSQLPEAANKEASVSSSTPSSVKARPTGQSNGASRFDRSRRHAPAFPSPLRSEAGRRR